MKKEHKLVWAFISSKWEKVIVCNDSYSALCQTLVLKSLGFQAFYVRW